MTREEAKSILSEIIDDAHNWVGHQPEGYREEALEALRVLAEEPRSEVSDRDRFDRYVCAIAQAQIIAQGGRMGTAGKASIAEEARILMEAADAKLKEVGQ